MQHSAKESRVHDTRQGLV